MLRFVTSGFAAFVFATLSGCAPDYSPNTYSGDAMQQANKVEPGIVIGFRQVAISADGTVGAVTGGAAGGILGAQYDATHLTSALSALGGTVVGGVVGSTVQHVVGKTTGWEYIVREPKGDLLSVTQEEPTPIPIGQKVLVITGKQARIVADYSVELPSPAAALDIDKAKPAQKETLPSAPPPVAAAAQPIPTPTKETATPAVDGAMIPVAATTSSPLAPTSADAPTASASEPDKAVSPDPAAPVSPAAAGHDGNAATPKTPPS